MYVKSATLHPSTFRDIVPHTSHLFLTNCSFVCQVPSLNIPFSSGCCSMMVQRHRRWTSIEQQPGRRRQQMGNSPRQMFIQAETEAVHKTGSLRHADSEEGSRWGVGVAGEQYFTGKCTSPNLAPRISTGVNQEHGFARVQQIVLYGCGRLMTSLVPKKRDIVGYPEGAHRV